MIDFFLTHVSGFLTIGVTALLAILLRSAAEHYAKEDEEP